MDLADVAVGASVGLCGLSGAYSEALHQGGLRSTELLGVALLLHRLTTCGDLAQDRALLLLLETLLVSCDFLEYLLVLLLDPIVLLKHRLILLDE